MSPNRTRIALLAGLLWVVALFAALTGRCGPAPSDRNPLGRPTPDQPALPP